MIPLNQYVVFKISSQFYGLSMSFVKDINRIVNVSKVSNLPEYIEGIINLHGIIYTVYNLRIKLGYEKRKYDDHTKIILLTERHVALIVDEVNEIAYANKKDIITTFGIQTDIKNETFFGILKNDNKLITILNINKILDGGVGFNKLSLQK